jgi:hypothetical protein
MARCVLLHRQALPKWAFIPQIHRKSVLRHLLRAQRGRYNPRGAPTAAKILAGIRSQAGDANGLLARISKPGEPIQIQNAARLGAPEPQISAHPAAAAY